MITQCYYYVIIILGVRTALLESEDNECPQTDCKEKGTSPNSLIPNRFLRNSVNTFQNETGYNKMRLNKQKEDEEAEEVVTSEQPQFSEDNSNASAGDALEESNEAENGEEILDADISEEYNNEAEASNGVESSGNRTADNLAEKDGIEAGEIKEDEKDSDDDNITVTVPPAHLQSWGPPFRGHHRRHHHHDSEYHSLHSHENRERAVTPTFDEKDEKHEDSNDGYRYREKPHHHKPMMHPGGSQHQEEHHGGEQMSNYPQVSQPMASGPDNNMAYSNLSMQPNVGYHQAPPSQMHPVPMHGQQYPPQQYPTGAPPYPGPQMNMRQPIRYDQHGYGPHMRPQMRPSGNYPMHGGHHFIRQRHIAPNNSSAHVAAAVTQDIQQQFGTGIIDDPLEAFNRIMREKELRKERNRRSPVPSTFERKRDYSPKNRSPDNHRKSPDDRNERNRGRSNDRHSPERERRRARSSSYNSASSRSFSRSRSRSRKRSTMRRRSRSRSHSGGR